jgi:hypothetical protein
MRRLALDTGRDLGIEDTPAIVDVGGARPEVEVLDLRICSSFQMRRPSMPPSTEMHSPEMCPAAR